MYCGRKDLYWDNMLKAVKSLSASYPSPQYKVKTNEKDTLISIFSF